jgi:putative flippase GtrA
MTRSLYEVALFACVGLAASVVHFLVAIGLIEHFSTPAWQANIAAFLCALPVSYFGHSLLTFSAKHYNRATRVSVQTLRKFFLSALAGFSLNQLSVVIFISWLGLPHRPVMFFTVFGVAGFLFLASKFWAFRGNKDAAKPSPDTDGL